MFYVAGRWLLSAVENHVMKLHRWKLKTKLRGFQSRMKGRFLAIKGTRVNT